MSSLYRTHEGMWASDLAEQRFQTLIRLIVLVRSRADHTNFRTTSFTTREVALSKIIFETSSVCFSLAYHSLTV